jgi:hypothetical protein
VEEDDISLNESVSKLNCILGALAIIHIESMFFFEKDSISELSQSVGVRRCFPMAFFFSPLQCCLLYLMHNNMAGGREGLGGLEEEVTWA